MFSFDFVLGVLFFSKEKSQTAELWEKLNFGNKDQNVKFRKLMGIKVSRAVNFISFLYQIHNLQLSFSFFFVKLQLVKFKPNVLPLQGDDDVEAAKPLNDDGMKTLQKQEEMFRNLDVQYEMARSQTHTQRGMGLGFSSSFSRGMDSM